MIACDKQEAAIKIVGLENQLGVLRKRMKKQLVYGSVVVVGAFGLGMVMEGLHYNPKKTKHFEGFMEWVVYAVGKSEVARDYRRQHRPLTL
ncbi:hypothetical protein LXL04_032861 [Taraxacum kok-saghyz]